MNRELWAEQPCEECGEFLEHDGPVTDDCQGSGGSRKLLDFDAIWDRYYDLTDTFRLTEDELRKVVFGE